MTTNLSITLPANPAGASLLIQLLPFLDDHTGLIPQAARLSLARQLTLPTAAVHSPFHLASLTTVIDLRFSESPTADIGYPIDTKLGVLVLPIGRGSTLQILPIAK